MLEETEHFGRCRQQEVAKIVHCGEHLDEGRWNGSGGLFLCHTEFEHTKLSNFRFRLNFAVCTENRPFESSSRRIPSCT